MMTSWAAVASLIGYRCESPEWRSGGADLGAFNMPTVGDDQHVRQGGVDTPFPLIRHPPALASLACSEAAADLISLAEDLEATSPPTATAVPVVPTWTPSPPDPSPAPATPTLAPTPEIAANSAVILALAVAETPPDVPDYGRNHWGRRIDEDGD